MVPKVMSGANAVLVWHCKPYWDMSIDLRLVREDDSDKLLATSGLFSHIACVSVDHIWTLSVDRFVAFLRST